MQHTWSEVTVVFRLDSEKWIGQFQIPKYLPPNSYNFQDKLGTNIILKS